jgi:hypothetical protein
MRFLGFVMLVAIGCGGTVASGPTDGSVVGDEGVDAREMPDVVLPDSGTCAMGNLLNPPLGCGPSGASPCGSTTNVASCPTDNACMAPVKQTAPVLEHRVGRLRLWVPYALRALAPIAFDPNINSRCANNGSEGFSWLLRIDTATKTLQTGPSRASSDGATFAFLNESYSGSDASKICPGFVGPTTPVALRAETAPLFTSGAGLIALIPTLTLTIFDSAGIPLLLPFRDARIRLGSVADPTCIGKWDRSYWCDGDTLGWTDGASLVAKISVEDADRVPVRSAGCQSLCAILANDATKTEGKVCKRGPDGKVPPIGNTCVGGEGCNDAWWFSATFSSYGVNITP